VLTLTVPLLGADRIVGALVVRRKEPGLERRGHRFVRYADSNRRGTDPYARWCGRGGAARLPPIPIFGTKRRIQPLLSGSAY
jgi:hypothetical protein